MAAFKPGDIVRIKGGADVMTIEMIEKLQGTEWAHCRWFDAKKQREGVFPSATLDLVRSRKRRNSYSVSTTSMVYGDATFLDILLAKSNSLR